MTTVDTPKTHGHSHPSQTVEWIARIGYAARGVIYLMIGGLALLAAVGSGGQTGGSKSALQSLHGEAYGQVLIILLAIGLLCYSLWRAVQSIKDPDNHGTDAKGLVIRVGLGVSALTHLSLAIYAASIVFVFGFGGGGGGGGGQSDSAQTWSGRLLRQPYGQWLLGLVGAAVIGVGIAQAAKAYREKYREHFKTKYRKNKWIDYTSKAGLYARGAVFAIMGVMLIVAAYQHDQYKAGGLGKALLTLQAQPYGWLLLGVVALGLICFGIYSLIEARYRRIGGSA
ncbi:MAG: DUF1206 domain-containing protein [Phycisphaerae bacterium]